MVETAWQLYDDLIDLIPAELTVTDALLSRVALVRNSAGGVGTASNDGGGGRERADDRRPVTPATPVEALVPTPGASEGGGASIPRNDTAPVNPVLERLCADYGIQRPRR